jgi:ribose 5-phosphate isomerase B
MHPLLAFASDHAGVELKRLLTAYARTLGMAVEDLGTHDTQSVDYPDYAQKLCNWMNVHSGITTAQGAARSGRLADTPGGGACPQSERMGILICGSGIGMSMAANRHAHIRAALVQCGLEARLARQHNNANVLCLGARIIGEESARDALHAFLHTPFEGGRHKVRVEKMEQ